MLGIVPPPGGGCRSRFCCPSATNCRAGDLARREGLRHRKPRGPISGLRAAFGGWPPKRRLRAAVQASASTQRNLPPQFLPTRQRPLSARSAAGVNARPTNCGKLLPERRRQLPRPPSGTMLASSRRPAADAVPGFAARLRQIVGRAISPAVDVCVAVSPSGRCKHRPLRNAIFRRKLLPTRQHPFSARSAAGVNARPTNCGKPSARTERRPLSAKSAAFSPPPHITPERSLL